MPYDNVILAENYSFSTDCTQTGRNNNIIVNGGTGSGKTLGVMEPCLMETNYRNLIDTVTKARIVKQYAPLLKRRNYQVGVLDFTNFLNCTIGYDPLLFVRSYSDITFLAHSIVMANPRKSGHTNADPYWDEAATNALCGLIAAVMMTMEEPTFADVIDMYKRMKVNYRKDTIIETSLDGLFQELDKADPGCYAVMNWKCFSELPSKTASCVMSTLNATIGSLFDPNLQAMMRMKNKLDFKEFAQEKSVLFVITSPVNTALHTFISQFYATALKELFDFAEAQPDGKLPIPVHIICDDFATGAPVPDFDQYISIIREKEISVTLLCQSESQLESLYSPSAATTIINNCDTYVYTGGMDLHTAKNISIRLDRPVEEVLSMPVGQFAIFRRGEKPVLAQRYNIFANELYQQVSKEYNDLVEQEKRAAEEPRPSIKQLFGESEIPQAASQPNHQQKSSSAPRMDKEEMDEDLKRELESKFDEIFGTLND